MKEWSQLGGTAAFKNLRVPLALSVLPLPKALPLLCPLRTFLQWRPSHQSACIICIYREQKASEVLV